jgi:hypothetical protein
MLEIAEVIEAAGMVILAVLAAAALIKYILS